jgi:hypothetical protein
VFIKVLLPSIWWMYTTAAWSESREGTYMCLCLYAHFPTSPPPHYLLARILPRPWDFPEWLHQCKNSVKFSREALQEKLPSCVHLCSWVVLWNRSGNSANICRHAKQWVLRQEINSVVAVPVTRQRQFSGVKWNSKEQVDIRTLGGYWQVDINY